MKYDQQLKRTINLTKASRQQLYDKIKSLESRNNKMQAELRFFRTLAK